ncbi:MAG: hypothetical protein ACP5O2_09800 [Bacteroidales bacterium]
MRTILLFFFIGFWLFVYHVNASQVVWSGSAQGRSFNAPIQISLVAEVSGIQNFCPAYTHFTHGQNGFRNPTLECWFTYVYAPDNNVLAGGNHTLQDFGDNFDWNAMCTKPNSVGSLPLSPNNIAAGGIGSELKTIATSLADFQGIGWTSVSYSEFPYSATSGNFDIIFSGIKFVGGNSPSLGSSEGKTNNKQSGHGGFGQVVSNLIEANTLGDYFAKETYYSDNQKIAENLSIPSPTTHNEKNTSGYQLKNLETSRYRLTAESAVQDLVLEGFQVVVSPLEITLTSPQNNTQYYLPTSLNLVAEVSGEVLPGPDYLKVVNNQTGYRKLKLGYTPGNIYGPGQNVIAGGNNILEIVLKDFSNTADWSKIRIRPNGKGLLNLAPYMANAQDLGNGWKKIFIPLSHFDPGIDFSSLSMFEFPYSAGAPFFEIGIASMIFIGGSSPFIWLGEGKTNNPHDGFNGPGQLLATWVNGNAGLISARKVEFYDHEELLSIDSIKPYSFQYQNVPSGLRKLTAKVYDSQGAMRVSDTVKVLLLDAPPAGSLILTITFDGIPTYVDFDKAKLRYNKDFAYSLTLDDGYRCAFKNAFMLLNGGYVAGNNTTYPGLFYTDGCGNDIPFRGGLSLYSLGATGNDLHVNSTSYINWPEVQTMIAAGWNIFNHSLQHAAGTGTDYVYQIVENTRYIKQKTGYVTRHFVVPSGDPNYVAPAFAHGMQSVIANNAAYQGFPDGLVVNNQLSYENFTLFKRLMYDTYFDTTNIFQPIQNAANLSVSGNHIWYCDFTHRVDFGNYTGSINFPLFAWYMQWIEKNYGKSGADNVWMAPIQEVYEYLYVRDHTPTTVSQTGSVMQVIIDRSQLPDSLLKYALSFVINSDVNIASVVMSQPGTITWRGNTPMKLINIEWTNNALKNATAVDLPKGELVTPTYEEKDLFVINPVKDVMQYINTAGHIIEKIAIFDVGGKNVYGTKEITGNAGKGGILLGGLRPGVYIVYFYLDDGFIVRKKILKL